MSVAANLLDACENLHIHEAYETTLWQALQPSQHAYELACERMKGDDPAVLDDLLLAMVKMGGWAQKILDQRAKIAQCRALVESLMGAGS